MVKLDDKAKSALIDLVQARPMLWKKDAEGYSDKDLRTRCFEEIGREFEIPGHEARSIWENLRGQYSKNLAKLPSGSARSDKKVSWKFFDQLSFLAPSMAKRITTSNVSDPDLSQKDTADEQGDDDDEEDDIIDRGGSATDTEKLTTSKRLESAAPSNKGNKRKASMDEFEKAMLDQLKAKDEEEIFGDWVASALRSMGKLTRTQVQIKIQQAVNEGKLSELVQQPSTSTATPALFATGQGHDQPQTLPFQYLTNNQDGSTFTVMRPMST